MLDKMLKRILTARVYDLAIETPLQTAPLISRRLGNEVLVKREDMQPVFSFKLRGAANKMRCLSPEALARGVICASAGNHAQGVALSARHLKVRSVIVMPTTTPEIKVNSVRNHGAEVVLFGDTFDQACTHALQLQKEHGLTFIHPYDDLDVIAGQGTIGMEIMRQTGPVDAIYLPVGGGGLAAGVAAYWKALHPETKIIAVEAEDSACFKAAFDKGERVKLPEVGIFADGVAVALVGEHTWEILRHTVDECITVSTDEICASIKDMFEDLRLISEPAGAVSLAGLKKHAEAKGWTGKKLVCISSGANVSFGRLRHISERTELGAHREGLFAVTIPERPGSFLAFCNQLGGCNITEFNYRMNPQTAAHLFVGIELKRGADERHELLKRLESLGGPVLDLTDNEMAKLHIRYMVGGHCSDTRDERLFRVEFPERPGALHKFISRLGDQWNISIFHYRNHAAAFGRVLLGIQCPDHRLADLKACLDEVGYPWHDESGNPAYDIFLS